MFQFCISISVFTCFTSSLWVGLKSSYWNFPLNRFIWRYVVWFSENENVINFMTIEIVNIITFESESLVAQSRLTLCYPIDCSLLGSSVHRIFQARILEWVPISFSRGSFWPRDQTHIFHIVGRHFYCLSYQWSIIHFYQLINKSSVHCTPEIKYHPK